MKPRLSFPQNVDSRLDSRDYLWLCLACALILAVAFLLPVHPNDYWWYLRLGGEIWQEHAIPQVEAWSASQAGQPVVYHAWLAALIFFGLNQSGGITTVVLARGLSLTGFYLFLYLVLRREGAGPRLAAGLVILAVLVGSSNWGVRPQVFTYPLFGLALWVLVCWQEGSARWLWMLPLVTLIWVNLHGSFPLVFLLAGAALVGGTGDQRKLALVMAAMPLASLMNPRGYGAWLYIVQMLTDPSVRRFSSEWKPAVIEGWQSALFFAWLLASFPLAAYTSRRLPLSNWLWWLGFGWLALSGIRNMIWFTAIMAVVSAAMLDPLLKRTSSTPHQPVNLRVNLGLGTILVLFTLIFLPGLRQRWWTHAPPIFSPDTPIQASSWLANQTDIKGKMWNDLDFSSYIIFALPQRPVWIDTRFEVYSPESWESYKNISTAGSGWQEWLDQQEIGLIVANNRNQAALIGGLKSLPSWCLRYEDTIASIFVHVEGKSFCPVASW